MAAAGSSLLLVVRQFGFLLSLVPLEGVPLPTCFSLSLRSRRAYSSFLGRVAPTDIIYTYVGRTVCAVVAYAKKR